MEKDKLTNFIPRPINYIVDFAVGPSVSAILERFVIVNPSEYLVGFIYLLGFSLSAFRIWQVVGLRKKKIDFLEKMVFRKQKKNGEEMEGGIIDANSVKMAEALAKL